MFLHEYPLEHNPFDSLYKTIVYSSADYACGKDRVWIYGIVVGWDDESIKELEKEYSSWWDKEDTKRLKEMHKLFVKIAKENGAKCFNEEEINYD